MLRSFLYAENVQRCDSRPFRAGEKPFCCPSECCSAIMEVFGFIQLSLLFPVLGSIKGSRRPEYFFRCPPPANKKTGLLDLTSLFLLFLGCAAVWILRTVCLMSGLHSCFSVFSFYGCPLFRNILQVIRWIPFFRFLVEFPTGW